MGKYKAVLSAFVMAVMILLVFSGCATAPSPAMPPDAEQEADWRNKYNWVDQFSEGRVAVMKDGKAFHVLDDGTPAYLERYDMVGSFFEGRAWVVMKNGEEFHIDLNGKPAYDERYDWVYSFYEGRARVEKDGEEFYIDLNGKRIEE